MDADGFRKRFFREAATCARLNHPHTVRVFDYGKLDDRDDTFFMAMELLEGRTLSAAIRKEAPFVPARAFRIACQIARSLREAHRLGIVHRDLKSPNVMLIRVDDGESVKVLDFGLAKAARNEGEDVTLVGTFVGSPRYMSPEQIRQRPVDSRADMYSLGVILYEMLAGKTPFDAGQSIQTMMAHLNEPVPPIAQRTGVAVAPSIEALVLRLLAKDPDERCGDVEDFFAGVREIAPLLAEDSGVRTATEEWESSAPGLSGPATPRPSPTAVAASEAPAARKSVPEEPTLVADETATVSAAAPLVPTAPRKRSAALFAALGLVACLVVVAVVAGLASQDRGPAPPEGIGPSAPAAATAPVAAAPATPPAAPASSPAVPAPAVSLRVESVPPGAEVWRGDTLLGPTPLTLGLEAEAVSLSVRARGYLPETLVQGPSDRDVVRVVRLSRRTGGMPTGPTKTPVRLPTPPDLEIKTTR